MTHTIPGEEARVLLPCPFCGAAVTLEQSHVAGEGWYIRHVPKVGGQECGMAGFDDFNIEGDLAVAWNTRAHQSPSRAAGLDGLLAQISYSERLELLAKLSGEKSIATGHADTEGEAAEMFAHLNCPACGGSGHVDDATSPVTGNDELTGREALGSDPLGFVQEGRTHAKDMPRCIQRDYLNAALDKIERAALATPAELPALPSREAIARLCERMSEQLANWEEDEPRDDWWAYQREYAKAHAILAALHPPASVAEVERYLVWSNEHQAWWGRDRCGYTRIIANAGRYDRAEALTIAGTRDGGWLLNKGNPDEIAIPERDAVEQYRQITDEQARAAMPSGEKG